MKLTKTIRWAGRVLSALPVAVLLMSAVLKLTGGPEVIEGMGRLGYPMAGLTTLAVLEIASTIVYVIPQTAVLGAVLLTGYLGGAIASHFRIGEPIVPPLAVALFAWVGLYLREERLHALLPLRQLAAKTQERGSGVRV